MEHLIFIVSGFILAVLLGRLIIPRILVISLRKRLFDIPDFRKIHQHLISCLGVLIPFFLYNVFGNAEHGSKIFMGDTGSLTLGFILSLLSVKYILFVSADSSAVYCTPIVWVFSLMLVPCLDVCRVVLDRLQRKANPFKPDKTHIHHKFLMMGFTPRRTLVLIQLMSLFFIGLTILLIHVGVLAYVVLLLDILVWTLMHLWFSHIIRRKAYYMSNPNA